MSDPSKRGTYPAVITEPELTVMQSPNALLSDRIYISLVHPGGLDVSVLVTSATAEAFARDLTAAVATVRERLATEKTKDKP